MRAPRVDGAHASSRARRRNSRGDLPLSRRNQREKYSGSAKPIRLETCAQGASRATRQRIDLGFSDAVTPFVNAEPIASADASYSYDQPRQEGRIGPDQLVAYVPLRPGINVVSVVVGDVFGGWGVQARLDPAPGARVVK